MVGKFDYLMTQLDRVNTESMAGKVAERMHPQTASVYSLDALAGTLTTLAKALEDSAGKEAPEFKVDLKGVESALKALSKAMNVRVEPPIVNVAAPSVEVKAPIVNVAAPNVEVLMPEAGVTRFDIYRDDRGLLKTVVATTVESFTEEDGMGIE